jgi:hypothetical protein
MDKINGVVAVAPVDGKKVTATATTKAAPKAATPAVSMTDDEDLEKSFPADDEQASS